MENPENLNFHISVILIWKYQWYFLDMEKCGSWYLNCESKIWFTNVDLNMEISMVKSWYGNMNLETEIWILKRKYESLKRNMNLNTEIWILKRKYESYYIARLDKHKRLGFDSILLQNCTEMSFHFAYGPLAVLSVLHKLRLIDTKWSVSHFPFMVGIFHFHFIL